MRQFGTSVNPEYLKKQIAQSNRLLTEQGYTMNYYQLLGLHKEIDMLNNRLRYIESPQLASDAREEYEAHQNADF